MKYFSDEIRLVAGIAAASLAIVLSSAAPQVSAQDARTQALERSIRQLEASLQAVRNELEQVKAESARDAQKLMRIEEKSVAIERRQAAESQKTIPVADTTGSGDIRSRNKNHMVFFRGGYAHMNDQRNGVSIQSNGLGGAGGQADKDAWYIGAGFDFNLTDDVWGLLPRTSVASELMFEYKEFSSRTAGNALPPVGAGVNVSQFTLTAAPKIRFLEGSRFRPWIIPAGLGIHVISPPSESITVLIPGVMFGAGADYKIWKDLYVGVDARYHLTSRNDGIKVDGVTAGGYLGIGF